VVAHTHTSGIRDLAPLHIATVSHSVRVVASLQVASSAAAWRRLQHNEKTTNAGGYGACSCSNVPQDRSLTVYSRGPHATRQRRVAALGEALSLTFRVALVQTVSRRPLTIPHDLSRPPHRQRRPDRSSRRPDSFSRPTIWRSWRRQRHSRCPGRSGPSTAVSCISRAFRAFRAFIGRPRLLYRPQR
jgi:hypothetical protein